MIHIPANAVITVIIGPMIVIHRILKILVIVPGVIIAGLKVVIANGREDRQLGQHVLHPFPHNKELITPWIDPMELIRVPIFRFPMSNLTAIGHDVARMEEKGAGVPVVIMMLNHGMRHLIDWVVVIRLLSIHPGISVTIKGQLSRSMVVGGGAEPANKRGREVAVVGERYRVRIVLVWLEARATECPQTTISHEIYRYFMIITRAVNARLIKLNLDVIAIIVHASIGFDQDMHLIGAVAVDHPGWLMRHLS